METCRVLSAYMHFRRNENDSSHQLVNIGFKLEWLNVLLQNSLAKKALEWQSHGGHVEDVIFSGFCYDMLHSLSELD